MKNLTAQHQSALRYNNSKAVIRVIHENRTRPISRADIAKVLQMSPTSITRIITSLMELNLIKQEESFSKGVGRKGINIGINKDAFYSLGFAIDCDYLKICLIDCERAAIAEDMCQVCGDKYDADELLQMGKAMYLRLCERYGISTDQVTCMGVSCCGFIDDRNGIVNFSPQLGWKNVNIKHLAETVFGLPVCVDNDIKMATIGATFQSAEMNNADVVYLSMGSGLGVAVMYQGKMIRGVNNAAGEIGHTMFSQGGRLCTCGKNGCLSTYLSEQGVIRECRSQGHEVKEAGDLMAAYNRGEEWAISMVDTWTTDMATAFCNMIYTYNPKYLLIGGNPVADFPELYEMAKEKFFDQINPNFNLDIIIKIREYKNNEALGAAFTAQEQYIDVLLLTDK